MAGKSLARRGIIAVIAALWLFAAVGPASAALPIFEQPRWSALTAEQRSILAPLKSEWDAMDAFRRKKWLGIAARYREMSPAEQESIQRNMREWARLAPEERKAAREQYKKLRKVAPEQRQQVKQKWQEYNALPSVTRDHMSDIAPKRPQVKMPKKSAAKPSAPALVSPAMTPSRSPFSPIKPPQSSLAPKAATKPPPPQPPEVPADK